MVAQSPKLRLGPLVKALKVRPLEANCQNLHLFRLFARHTLSGNLLHMTDACRDTTKDVGRRLRLVSLRSVDRTMRDYLGDAIKARRKQLGLGQEDLADRIGCSSRTLSRWEAGGDKDADGKAFVRLEEIAPALETTPAKLLSMALGLAGYRDEPQPAADDLRDVLTDLLSGSAEMRAQLAAIETELEDIGRHVKRSE